MSDTSLADTLLRHALIHAQVGDRIALAQLPKGMALPAIAYQVYTTPQPYLAAGAEPIPQLVRLQINPLAVTTAQVDAIHAAIYQALAWRAGEMVDGHSITLIAPQALAGWSKDEPTGAWTRPRDYLITFEE